MSKLVCVPLKGQLGDVILQDHMKKISILIFCLSFVFNLSFAQSTERKLSDYGLSAEQAKKLTAQEIKDILSQPTPDEIINGMSDANKKEVPYVYPEGYPVQIVEKKEIPNTVNCFDYYKFGSVQTDISISTTTVKAGDTILFTGTVRSENDYPIVGGQLYVKINKTSTDSKNLSGFDTIDQFVVIKNISIPTKGHIPVSFSWKVPEYSEGGEYSLVSYFIVDNKFNLLGLSFTDDIVGSMFNFDIISNNKKVYLDKTNIKINGYDFRTDIFPMEISTGTPAIIKSTIVNNTDIDETVTIKTKLYEWDAINPDSFIRESKKDIFVKANSTTTYEFIVSEDIVPVYYVEEELNYKDSKSFLNVRFVRSEINKLKLDFQSILSYPINKNSTSTVFACFHNIGSPTIEGKIILKVLDKKDKVVNEYIYNGDVLTTLIAVKSDFVSKKDLKDFSIEAELWQGNKLVDKSVMKYSCKDIDPENCDNNLILYILIVILSVIVLGLLLIKIRNKKVK